ncbi:hypothetical protein SCLCIDRAFT_22338 [Scleroderma citrinum Foug A]|uniref:Uncharacterized protein n=1 Tax=Scleroderma citrinum Foug A TaxID=1036808 RepID=A0A0C2ZW86_9AGAM|nr:hypothetical protein SCLCIDRAFT_22338 [Scleroderma citrinum Foug A]
MQKLIRTLHHHVEAPPASYIQRSRFDMATLMAGSMDPTETFGGISEWLASIRLNLQSSALTLMRNVSIRTFGSVCRWLRDVGTSVVSAFVFLRYFVTDMLELDHYRIDLDPAVLPPRSIGL